MTHQEKLAFIRAKCIEANPEIVELKFGCEISGYGHHLSKIITVGERYCSFLHHPELVAQDRTKTIQEHYQILGRPIRLADVLLVAKMVGYNTAQDWFKVLGRITDLWSLLKDDLSDQSELTINFIHDLVK